jgi:hypothetical protein
LEGRSSDPRSPRPQVHPKVKRFGVVTFIVAALFIGKIMLDAIYIGLVIGFFMAFCIYAAGCEKL